MPLFPQFHHLTPDLPITVLHAKFPWLKELNIHKTIAVSARPLLKSLDATCVTLLAIHWLSCEKSWISWGMLFKVEELVTIWNCPIGEVLHVGAHQAEELEEYLSFGFEPITWVEAQPELALDLAKKLDPKKNTVLNFAAWDTSGEEKILQITNNSQSSSLLNLKRHLTMYPEIKKIKEIKVQARRIDSVISSESNFALINIDVQGVELKVLIGLGDILRKTEMIYCEVNRKFLYEDCAQVSEIDSYLETYGFKRVATRWFIRAGWGDAIYQKINLSRRNKKQMIKHILNQFIFYKPQAYSLIRKIVK